MLESLARLIRFKGYELLDAQYSSREGTVKITLETAPDKACVCYRCKTPLTHARGQHRLCIQELSIMNCKTYLHLWRRKGHCPQCKKARSEQIEFLAEESPHLSKSYAEWLARMCEFSPVSRVAEFCDQDNMTVRRLDYAHMRKLLKRYKIPEVRRISVDEVYARKKSRYENENRNKKFFTIISDLDTRRVIWVSEGRSKEALDEFFNIIGEAACKKIVVAAMDQFEGYAASVKQHCKNATIVWDKFHIMRSFEEAVNEARKELHQRIAPKDPLFRLTQGRYRFLFLKRDSSRSGEEKRHLDDVFKQNEQFLQLEIIKERMLSFFDAGDEVTAKGTLEELIYWVYQIGLNSLKRFLANLYDGWDTLKNYFTHPVSSALSEGQNNVIKSLKRRAFGFRNMDYFRLKIMQVCGYLNSRYAGKLA